MRIVCPDCDAVYEVPERLLEGRERPVRCARCGTTWTPLPTLRPTAAPAPGPAPGPALEMPPPPPRSDLPMPDLLPPDLPPLRGDRRLASYRPRGAPEDEDERLAPMDDEADPPGRGALLGWVATVVLLAAVVWAGLAYRSQVMAAWPASERLYAAIGLR